MSTEQKKIIFSTEEHYKNFLQQLTEEIATIQDKLTFFSLSNEEEKKYKKQLLELVELRMLVIEQHWFENDGFVV